MIRGMVIFNCLEPFMLFLLMLNSLIYPNFPSAIYFSCSIFLTFMCLHKSEKKIKLKQILSIGMMVFSILVLILKTVFIVNLHK